VEISTNRRGSSATVAQVWDQLPHEFKPATTELRLCVEMVKQPEVFARLIELRPHNSELWRGRGRMHVMGRKWTQASADFAKMLELRAGGRHANRSTERLGIRIRQSPSV